jgi:hypothetical protein
MAQTEITILEKETIKLKKCGTGFCFVNKTTSPKRPDHYVDLQLLVDVYIYSVVLAIFASKDV